MMKKNFGTDSLKRCISTLLALVMLMSCVGISAFAEETCEHSSTTTMVEPGAAATCTEDGYHTVVTVCADCGQELSRETVTDTAPGHDWGEGVVTLEATTEAEGEMTYTCSRCYDSYTLPLPKLEAETDSESATETKTVSVQELQPVLEQQTVPGSITVQEPTLQITESSSAYGRFVADSPVPAGTELRFEAVEAEASVLDVVKKYAAGQMNADPSELQTFVCNVWLFAPEGTLVATGAEVTLKTALSVAAGNASMQVSDMAAVYASENGTLHFQKARETTENGIITGITFYAPEPATYAICYVLNEDASADNKKDSRKADGEKQSLQITEGSSACGSFVAASPVPAGTELRFEAVEADESVLEFVKKNVADQMNADPSELYAFACNVWLSSSDGTVVNTGADVTLETALPLPVVDEKAEEPVFMQVDKVIAVYASEDKTLHVQEAKASTEKGSITAISFYAPEPATYAICFTMKEPEKSVDEEGLTEEITLEEFREQLRQINNTRALDIVPDTMYVEKSDTNGLTERLYIDVSRVTKTTSWSSQEGETFTYEVICSICLPDAALDHIADCKFSWDGTIKATVYNASGNTLQSNVSRGSRSVPSVGQTERYYFTKTQNGQTFKIYYNITTDSVPTAMWIKAKDNGLPGQVDVVIKSTANSSDDNISVSTYTCELLLPGTADLGNCFLSWNGELKATVDGDTNGPYKSGKCPIPAIGETKTYVFSQGRRRVEFVVTAYDALPDTMWVDLSNTEQSDPSNTEESDPSNTERIFITKNGNSYELKLPFGIPEGCMFHWNGELKASIANDSGGPYASGECPVPGNGLQKTYTFTNTRGDQVSFTVRTSVIEPKLRVEPKYINGNLANNIPAAIDIFVSNTATSTSGSGNNKKTTYTYTSGLYLPGNAALGNCVLTWDGEIKATVNGAQCSSGECPVPGVDSTMTYSFVNGNTTWKYNITTYQGSPGVPAVFIDIDESMGTIAAMDGDPSHDTECSGRINISGAWYGLTKMKGRGNYTWEKAQDKKPYNITLDTSINFPGVSSGKTKKWSFLAEIFDPSLLCNRSGYWLASQLGVGQDTTSADVWMNGEYQGCYTVTPKTDSFVPDNGFMIEEDNYLEDPVSAGGDPQFTLVGLNETSGWSSCYNRITVKEMGGSWTVESLRSWLQDAWNAINSGTGYNDKSKYYTEYIDIESFAKMYLMHEYVKSYDVCAGSILFYCNGDSDTDKLIAGPLWDLDNAMGSTYENSGLGNARDRRSGSGNFIPNINEYKTSFFKALYNHDDFKAEVSKQYRIYSSAFDSLPGIINGLSGSISASAEMNHAKVEKITGSGHNDNHNYDSTTEIDGQTYVATNGVWANYVANLRTYAVARSVWFQESASFHQYDSWIRDPVFNGHAILLTGQIGLQFFLQLPDGETSANYPDSYVTFEGNKMDSSVHHLLPASTVVIDNQDTGRYEFIVNLSSIQMADQFIPTFHYTKDGVEKMVTGDAYAVKDYIDWALGPGFSSLNDKQQAIIPTLADYGYYAQPYLSRQNNWTIGTDYAEMTTRVSDSFNYDAVKEAAENSAFSRTNPSNDVEVVNYRLTFGTQLTLTVRIKPVNNQTFDTINIDGTATSIAKSGEYYLVDFTNPYANQLADSHTIIAGDCTIRVSPMSYVYEMLSRDSSQNDLKNLMCALYNYAKACHNYH